MDERWIAEFEKIGSFLILPAFEGDPVKRLEQKNKFLSGEIDNPEFDYPRIDLQGLENNETALLKLKQEIRSQETVTAVRLAYQWAINEKIAEIRMLKETARGNMHRFNRWSRFVNGEPSPEIFQYITSLARDERDKCRNSVDPAVLALVAEVDELLPVSDKKLEVSLPPTDKEIADVKAFTEKKMGPLIALTGGMEGNLDRDQVRQACDQALKVIKADGWRAVIEEGSRVSIMVDPQEKR